MEKYIFDYSLGNIVSKVSEVEGESFVYRLRDGSFLKVFTDDFVRLNERSNGNSLELKILESKNLKLPYYIKKPKDIYYTSDGRFKAYSTPGFDGIDIYKYFYTMGFFDQMLPENYTKIYRRIESAIVEANKEGVVFPDICSEGNVLYNPRSGSIALVDYDGFQIGEDRSIVYLSEALGDRKQYDNPKYSNNGLYTSELDKKSMIIHYFANAFDVNLSMVGKKDPITGCMVTVDGEMDKIGIYDSEIRDVVKTAFSDKGSNGSIVEAVSKFDYEDSIFLTKGGKTLVKGRVRF